MEKKSEKFRNVSDDGIVTYRCMSCRKLNDENRYQPDDDMQHPICNACNWIATTKMTEWNDIFNALSYLDPTKPEDSVLFDEILEITKYMECEG
jgi:hypothetical protein